VVAPQALLGMNRDKASELCFVECRGFALPCYLDLVFKVAILQGKWGQVSDARWTDTEYSEPLYFASDPLGA